MFPHVDYIIHWEPEISIFRKSELICNQFRNELVHLRNQEAGMQINEVEYVLPHEVVDHRSIGESISLRKRNGNTDFEYTLLIICELKKLTDTIVPPYDIVPTEILESSFCTFHPSSEDRMYRTS